MVDSEKFDNAKIDSALMRAIAAALASSSASKNEIARYLEDQVGELGAAIGQEPAQSDAVRDVAGTLSKVAREHDLTELAGRLDELGKDATAA